MLKSDRISKRRSVSILIGIGLICWGLLWFFGQLYAISYEMEWANSHPDHAYSVASKKSIIAQLWTYHNQLILSILSLSGGVAFLYRKKVGWIIVFVVSLIELIHFIKFFAILPTDKSDLDLFIFVSLGMATLFLISTVLMLLPQIRQHYSVKFKDIGISLGLTIIILIDQLIW